MSEEVPIVYCVPDYLTTLRLFGTRQGVLNWSTRTYTYPSTETVYTTTSCLNHVAGVFCNEATVLTETTIAPATVITDTITWLTTGYITYWSEVLLPTSSCTTITSLDENDIVSTQTTSVLSMSTPDPTASSSTTTLANGKVSVHETFFQPEPTSVWVPVIQTTIVGRRQTSKGASKIGIALGIAAGIIVLLAILWLIRAKRLKRLSEMTTSDSRRRKRFSLDMDETRPFGSRTLTSNREYHAHTASSSPTRDSPSTQSFTTYTRSAETGLQTSPSTTHLLSPTPPSFSDHYSGSPPQSPRSDIINHFDSPVRVPSPLSSPHSLSRWGSSSTLMTQGNPSLSTLSLHGNGRPSLRRLPSEADVTSEPTRSDSPSSVHELPFGSLSTLNLVPPEPASPLRITNASDDDNELNDGYLAVRPTIGSRNSSIGGQRSLSPIEESGQSSEGHGSLERQDPFADLNAEIGRKR